MLLTLARRRKFLFVGGKGGSGKTSVSSALALARAAEGARVLLVSTDPAHSLGYVWDRKLTDTVVRVFDESGSVDAIEVDPDATIERHFDAVRRTMLQILPERLQGAATRHLDVAKTAPGSHEAAMLERIAEVIEQAGNYDLVVFDTAPSGHTLRLLALPERLFGWTESLLASRKRSESFAAAARGIAGTTDETSDADGRLRRTLHARRERFAMMSTVIADHSATAFAVVTLAENLSVAETIDITGRLQELGIDVGSVVVNRRSPADAGQVLADQRQREAGYIRRLVENLDDVPITELPLVTKDLTGTEALRELAGHVGDCR
ncbi:ArsA family ATPase [Spelaeicoccus albus]|uniref:Arsenite-transporting ATPase n=1 Tax=Spelaeicoccus albus TaxID=1280376 RepID=A0A7Z0D1T5_9MICO|nr:ArsA family ATPase [Spelaeicoccus albus]NYI66852.1 arsenite-transporting ATPase [Spelaeicoccus albus]